MTAADIRALGPTTDLETAGRPFGIGRNVAYQLNARGQFPVPVLRVGRKYRVRTADILRELGYDVETTGAAPG